MAPIAEALKKTKGATGPGGLMGAFKGMKINSPRGPIMIDPETRDIVQTVYVRRVEKVNGQLVNVEFDRFPDVRAPGKKSGGPLRCALTCRSALRARRSAPVRLMRET